MSKGKAHMQEVQRNREAESRTSSKLPIQIHNCFHSVERDISCHCLKIPLLEKITPQITK